MKKLRIGSRESALAVAQSMTLINYLKEKLPDRDIELVTMKTTGDKILDKTLDKAGGKGLFVKELETALRDRYVDLTVHSLKDVTMEVSEDIPLIGFSKREDPRDVLVLPEGESGFDMTRSLGSSSLRRKLQLSIIYPGCRVESVRGNIQTRLKKLDEGQYGSLILAAAGLKRLMLENRVHKYFDTEEMIPAAGQGILAVQGRAGEDYGFLQDFIDKESETEALSERAFIRELNGGCTSPVCAHSRVTGDEITLKGLYYDERSGRYLKGAVSGNISQAEDLGKSLADDLRSRVDKGEGSIWQ
ncbi:MAG: hydroxymethylbilane synthase [Lachnospiraceae bacterium]|nr:hydroxymethylbilane synthase [Lachnospiraceae bacterium]